MRMREGWVGKKKEEGKEKKELKETKCKTNRRAKMTSFFILYLKYPLFCYGFTSLRLVPLKAVTLTLHLLRVTLKN